HSFIRARFPRRNKNGIVTNSVPKIESATTIHQASSEWSGQASREEGTQANPSHRKAQKIRCSDEGVPPITLITWNLQPHGVPRGRVQRYWEKRGDGGCNRDHQRNSIEPDGLPLFFPRCLQVILHPRRESYLAAV